MRQDTRSPVPLQGSEVSRFFIDPLSTILLIRLCRTQRPDGANIRHQYRPIDRDYAGGNSQQKGSCIDHGAYLTRTDAGETYYDSRYYHSTPIFHNRSTTLFNPSSSTAWSSSRYSQLSVTAPKILDFEIIKRLGRIEEDKVLTGS